MSRSYNSGFTLVEMLVTMVVGVLFVGTLYQLYIVTITSATEANRDAKASTIGYELLRSKTTSATQTPCVASSTNHNLASEGVNTDGLPTPVTAVTQVDCPYSTMPQINRITVVVRYGQGSNQTEVRHAIFSSQ